MFEIADQDLFGKVIAEEITAVNGNRSLTTGEQIRFVNAIAKAASRIERDGVWMDYDKESDKLLIWSNDSNQIYEVNGHAPCQCVAFGNGHVCWHRAAKRLITRYQLAEQIETEVQYMTSNGWNVAGNIREVAK